MSSNIPMRAGGDTVRWTPAWVLTVSFLTPASAWALHSVTPDLVAWYVGIMGWLILTPEKGMRLRLPQLQASPIARNAGEAQSWNEAGCLAASPVRENPETAAEIDNALTDANGAKAKKPRSRARKPKALTLAEVKALTASADRAVVWSQVSPGKFVRNPGDETAEQCADIDVCEASSTTDNPQVIEAVVRNSTILSDEDSE